MAFSRKKIEERKAWLRGFVPGTYLDHTASDITYTDFVNKVLSSSSASPPSLSNFTSKCSYTTTFGQTSVFSLWHMHVSVFIQALSMLQELILFSRADLERSIPSMLDGLKPGQRKILFGCFKRNLTKDIKVGALVSQQLSPLQSSS